MVVSIVTAPLEEIFAPLEQRSSCGTVCSPNWNDRRGRYQ